MLLILLTSTVVIPNPTVADEDDSNAWDPLTQPWAQYGRDPGHTQLLPDHGETGLMTIETPAVNWVAFDSGGIADGWSLYWRLF